jgi:hypothetical protein
MQRADIIGKEKLLATLAKYKFCRVEIRRGTNVVMVQSVDNNDQFNDLIESVEEWAESVGDGDNSQLYKISLSGKNNPDKQGSGTKFLTLDFRLTDPVKAPTQVMGAQGNQETYMELGELRAVNTHLAEENENLRNQLEELEAMQDEAAELAEPQTDLIGSVLAMAKPHIPTILSLLVEKLSAPKAAPIQLAGTGDDLHTIVEELKKHDPELQAHLLKLLNIATTEPGKFKMLLTML